jgi:hypothetical protein
MERSQQIARLAGPVFCAIGIGMLTNQAIYQQMAGQFLAAYPFIYFSGIAILLAGLLILNSHNVWTKDWRISVTLLGWAMCAVGAFRLIAPQFVVYVGGAIFSNGGFFIGTGAAFLALGGFFTFKGYAL